MTGVLEACCDPALFSQSVSAQVGGAAIAIAAFARSRTDVFKPSRFFFAVKNYGTYMILD